MKIRGNAKKIWRYIKINTSDDIILKAIYSWLLIYRYLGGLYKLFGLKKDREFTLYIKTRTNGNKITTYSRIETRVLFNIRFFNIKDIRYKEKKKEKKNARSRNRGSKFKRQINSLKEDGYKTVNIIYNDGCMCKVYPIYCHCDISEGQLRFAK